MPAYRFTVKEAQLLARAVLYNQARKNYQITGEQTGRIARKLEKIGVVALTGLTHPQTNEPSLRHIAIQVTPLGRKMWASHLRQEARHICGEHRHRGASDETINTASIASRPRRPRRRVPTPA